MKKRITYIFIITLILIAILSAVKTTVRENRQTIKVGIRYDFNSFGYYNAENDHYSGFEVDLSKIIFNRLGYKNIEYVPIDANNREELLASGDIDCIMGGYSYSDARNQKFDLSTPYYSDSFIIVSLRSSMFPGVKYLSDCSIGIINSDFVESTVKKILVEEKVNNINIVKCDDYTKLNRVLCAAKVDAIALDKSLGLDYLNSNYYTVLYQNANASEFCVALPKNSPLTSMVDEQLNILKDDGTIDELMKHWGIE